MGGGRRQLASLLALAALAAPAAAAGPGDGAAGGPSGSPAAAAPAAEGGPAVGAYELGLQAGYSFGVINNAQMVSFFPRLGRVVAVTRGARPGVVTFGLEGLFSRVIETTHAMELGGGLLLRYRLLHPRLQPYAELGGAMLYSDLRNFSLGSRILFAVQPAVGVEIPLGGGLGLTAGYRFRHISNAGQSRINPGLNSHILVAGVSYLR
jgi:lipid A 3-O-deacylase